MSSPKNQHYIPRSYLRNFAEVDDDKVFMEGMNVKSGEIIYPLSTKNLCSRKHLYTIPNVDEKDKYFLEHYYAANVDGVYPEVYKMLIDKSVRKIDEEDRQKILSTCLSLYFRSARFLDERNHEVDEILSRIEAKTSSGEAKLFINYGGRNYKFSKQEIPDIREVVRNNNKLDFIQEHFAAWKAFIEHKNFSQITVIEVPEEVPLITSDNPVDIYNPNAGMFDIFDPANTIQLPLDPAHYLWISPNDEDSDRHLIYRGVRDKWFALTSNSTTHQRATDMILGKQGSITRHLDMQAKYNEDTPENNEALEEIKSKAMLLSELLNTLEEEGGITTSQGIERLRAAIQNPILCNDANFQKLAEKLSMKGFDL